MDKFLEKIYSEKDLPTNIAIFVGAIVSLCFYLYFGKDPFSGLVVLLSLFSLTKIIAKILIDKHQLKKRGSLDKKYYSDLEKDVILTFTQNGTCFLQLSEIRDGRYNTMDAAGVDSLVSRGVIEFVDRSFGDGPTGFQLKEDVYKLFL
jgi:hypothetical protein